MHASKLPPQNQSIDPILWTAFAVCLICIAILAFAFGTTTTPTHSQSRTDFINSDPAYFPALSIDNARLIRERREQQSEARLGDVDPELSHLYTVVRRANLAQFPHQKGQEQTDPIMLTAEVTFAADEILPASGIRGFTAAGEPIFADCNEGIEDLLKAVRLKSLSIEQALQNPPDTRFQKYRENCGNALPMLVQHGLIASNGQWATPHASTIFDILNRFRWAHITHARLPARLQLAPYEYELLMRWRIEDPEVFSTADRQKFIEQAAHEIRDFDATLTKVLLANEGKDRNQAIKNLHELSQQHPDNQDYKRRYQRALQFKAEQ